MGVTVRVVRSTSYRYSHDPLVVMHMGITMSGQE